MNPERGSVGGAPTPHKMGACMSANSEETEQKKRSQKIDKDLEEDSKRLRRECKILLLGTDRPITQARHDLDLQSD